MIQKALAKTPVPGKNLMPISWITFAATVAFLYLALAIPGFISLRSLGLPRLLSLACAPVVALACAAVFTCIYPVLGVSATSVTVLAPLYALALLLCLGAIALKRLRRTTRKPVPALDWGESNPEPPRTFTYAAAAAYVAVGLAVAAYALLEPLGNPDAIVFSHDNVRHFGQIECFVESGVWSSLCTTLYPEGLGAEIDPFGSSSFYPSAWHLVAAIAVDALGAPVSFAANAANVVFAAIIYPVGMLALIAHLFPGKKDVVLIGAVCASAFTAFPWTIIGVWEVYPFAAALCLVPAVAACFIRLLDFRNGHAGSAACLATIVLDAIALALTQPSAVFTTAVFLAPFCLAAVYHALYRMEKRGSITRRGARMGTAAFALLIVALWALACILPPIKQAMSWSWDPVADPANAILDAAFLSFAEPMPQIVLALAVFAGCAYCFRTKRRRWLVVAFCIACVMFALAAALPNVPAKQILTGFWYTDYYRIAAFAAMFATPLASAGLAHVARSITRNASPRSKAVACIVVVALFCLVNFRMPVGDGNDLYLDSPFARTRGMVEAHSNTTSANCYDAEKRAFVEEAVGLTGPDAPVINLPYDGSLYAFASSDMNLYQRYMTGYEDDAEESAESAESVHIRHALYNIARDARTREAVRAIGAKYVLILDRNEDAMRRWFWCYDESDWGGIELIRDNTPGFEVVLAEGDMRLYRITALNEPQV